MITRIVLWLIAFIVPAISLGVPVPHMLYVLIPALAAVDGLRTGGTQRLVVWVGLSVLYEVVYQMPLGVFALTIGIVAVMHYSLMRIIRVDTRVPIGGWRPAHLYRALLIAVLWMGGMVIISSALYGVMGAAAPISWHALGIAWFVRGAVFASAGILVILLGVLFWERTLRVERIFSDHAIVQTTDISS